MINKLAIIEEKIRYHSENILEVRLLQIRRIMLNEFIVPDVKGFERTDDKDDKTEYLFLKAPKNTYTLYFL